MVYSIAYLLKDHISCYVRLDKYISSEKIVTIGLVKTKFKADYSLE